MGAGLGLARDPRLAPTPPPAPGSRSVTREAQDERHRPMRAIVTHVFLAHGAGTPWNSHVTNLDPARPTCDGGPSPRVVLWWSSGHCLGMEDCCESSRKKRIIGLVEDGRSPLALPPSACRRCCGCDETATATSTAAATTTNPRSQCAHARPAGSGWPAGFQPLGAAISRPSSLKELRVGEIERGAGWQRSSPRLIQVVWPCRHAGAMDSELNAEK